MVKVYLKSRLPYYNFRGDLVQLHGQFNNSVLASKTTRNNLHKLTSLYDLSLFNLNTNLGVNFDPYENLSTNQFRSRYSVFPHSFAKMQSRLSKNERLSSFSIIHNNVLSINKNLENLQTQILEELEFHFDIIGISDTNGLPIQIIDMVIELLKRLLMKYFKPCGLKCLLLQRKILFVVSFSGSTTHWNVFRDTLKKQSRSLLLWVSRFAFSVILTSTF